MKKLLYIGNKLSKHGATATSIETLGTFLEAEGFEVFYASSKKNKILRLLDMIYTTWYYRKKVDYVLIDVYSTLNFWYAVIISQLCRVFNIKYVAKLHGGNLPYRLQRSLFFCDILFKNANAITVPSHYLMEQFSRYTDQNLLHIPNSIDIKNYPYQERDIDEPKLLWVRSFAKIYNPKMAVTVLSYLKKEFPNATLCMVGPDKEHLMESVKQLALDMNVSVSFKGKLSKKEWIALSENFNVFINTTDFDNTPVSLIEAMALGLPVVTTNVGGIPFLIENQKTGILVKNNDALGMVNAIKELHLNSKLRSSIVKSARAQVSFYDWNVVKLKWLDLLK